MHKTLLTLPRELRDEIYSYILSPTGTVALIPTRETSIRRGCAPVTILPCTPSLLERPSSLLQTKILSTRLNLSVLKTCSQLYTECRNHLFHNNVFFFRDALDVERVMDEMGQTQSRRIERMVVDISKGLGALCVNRDEDSHFIIPTYVMPNLLAPNLPAPINLPINRTKDKYKGLRKLVRKSLSRSRAGSLTHLSLRINGEAMLAAAGVYREGYDQLLTHGNELAGNQADWGGLGREVEIWMDEAEQREFDALARDERGDGELEHVLMMIHLAWRCRVRVNGVVFWDKCVRNEEAPVLKVVEGEEEVVPTKGDRSISSYYELIGGCG